MLSVPAARHSVKLVEEPFLGGPPSYRARYQNFLGSVADWRQALGSCGDYFGSNELDGPFV